MGFSKWLLKNGPGSIGSTAKSWAKAYINAKSVLDEENAKLQTIDFFTRSMKTVHVYKETDPFLLLIRSEGCLAVLMWLLNLEIPSNLKSLINTTRNGDLEIINTSLEVVYEKVHDVSSKEIKFDMNKYKKICEDYLFYRIVKDSILKRENGMISFKVAYFDNNNWIIKTPTDGYQAFEEYKLLLNLRMERSIGGVWLAEMIGNKYVYMHFCTDENYRDEMNKSIERKDGNVLIAGVDL